MAKIAALLVAFGLAGLWGYQAHETAAAEHVLASIASPLAGRDVGVECQGFWAALFDIQDRLGDVNFPDGIHPENHANLTRDVCRRLHEFRPARIDCLTGTEWSRATLQEAFGGECGRRVRSTTEAIVTLAHESMHLRGIRGEAEAQCRAIEALPYVADRLGATPAQGAALAAYALALQPGMPQEYQFDGECGR